MNFSHENQICVALCGFSPLCVFKRLVKGVEGAVLSFPGHRLCLPGQPWHRPTPCPTGGGQLKHTFLSDNRREKEQYHSTQAMGKSLEFFSLDEGVKEQMSKGPEYQVESLR